MPGFTPHRTMPPVPDSVPEAPRPLVLEHAGRLGDPARMRSERARRAARQADPSVPEALADAEWEAHHLVNAAGLRRVPELVQAAGRAGWRADDSGNVAPLPASREAQEKLRRQGVARPLHDSGHRAWNDDVSERLRTLRKAYGQKDLRDPAVEREIKRELERGYG